jgi:uncharacterized protein
MKQNIQEFIDGKRVALMGASRSGKKFGNSIYTELKQRGYQVFLVHPQAKEILGEPCYPNLAALRGRVDGVVICLSPSQAGQAVQEAAQAGIKHIWLQQGAESGEVIRLAQELGLDPVAGKCILMYAPPVRSVHGLHRGFMKLFGKL